jgi:hypothetical protein
MIPVQCAGVNFLSSKVPRRAQQMPDELARAEVSAQAVDRHVREIGQFMYRRIAILRVTDGALEEALQNESTRDNSDIENGYSLPQNSGMYS